MTTHVESMVSEVVTEPEPAAQENERPGWQQTDTARWVHQRLETINNRTRAEGFDD